MKFWRHTLHCLFMFVLASGAAAAENEITATCGQLMIVARASESASHGSSWFFPASGYSRHGSGDTEQIADTGNVIGIESEGRCCDAISNTTFVGLQMENALIDDEVLGRISGGAVFFETPDVINQSVFAIKLWDESKFRSSTPYKQINGQIINTISIQGR